MCCAGLTTQRPVPEALIGNKKVGRQERLVHFGFMSPSPILDSKKHHACGWSRSGAKPNGTGGGDHSLELLKAKMLFLEGKYCQDYTVAFNLISQLKKESRKNHANKGSCPRLLLRKEKNLLRC